jgi:hypothetical protein
MLELAAFIRASSEVEPAPPMRAHLIWQIDSRARTQDPTRSGC